MRRGSGWINGCVCQIHVADREVGAVECRVNFKRVRKFCCARFVVAACCIFKLSPVVPKVYICRSNPGGTFEGGGGRVCLGGHIFSPVMIEACQCDGCVRSERPGIDGGAQCCFGRYAAGFAFRGRGALLGNTALQLADAIPVIRLGWVQLR